MLKWSEVFANERSFRSHIFYSQRVMDIPDGIPKWTKIDKTSELIEDSPPEMVKELERQRKMQMDSQIQNREVTT